MSETRVCRTCGAEKEIEEFRFSGLGNIHRVHDCYICLSRRSYERAQIAKVQKEINRMMAASTIETQMDIIDACWAKCCQAGHVSIDRMIAATEEATYLPGRASGRERLALRGQITEYRNGRGSLAAIKEHVATLASDVGIARAS